MGSKRLGATFERLQSEGACGLFPYFTAGYPDVATSQKLVEAALAAGVDGFEVAVPFSDPLADGVTLQRANAHAVAGGAGLDTALDLAAFIRARSANAPVLLMSYYNPVLRRGHEVFAEALAASGGDGAIVPDLPEEEAGDLRAALTARGLDLVSMLAPTSPDERIQRIGSSARGFIYCVALVGVTGARAEMSTELGDLLARIRRATSVPLVVGFGIARPEHVRRVHDLGADGAIVASALTDLIEKASDPVAAARSFLTEMKAATRTASPTEPGVLGGLAPPPQKKRTSPSPGRGQGGGDPAT